MDAATHERWPHVKASLLSVALLWALAGWPQAVHASILSGADAAAGVDCVRKPLRRNGEKSIQAHGEEAVQRRRPCRPSDPDLRAAEPAPGMIALRAALAMVGVPYSWGGGGPDGPSYGIGHGAKIKGFDCSGLAEYAWAQAQVRIGATTREQWRSGARIRKKSIEPGDLVFYDPDPGSPGPEHVGIAIDRKRIVNAPFTGEVVQERPLARPDFKGAIRPQRITKSQAQAGRNEQGAVRLGNLAPA